MTTTQKNLRHEYRAVEEGHRAVVQPGGWVRVVSDTHPDKHYRVEFWATAGGLVQFKCRPEGNRAYTDDHLCMNATGEVGCKHQALAARRLEREGLVRLDGNGHWVTTKPHTHDFSSGRCPCGEPQDPFDGI